jgi:hypothetical protein
MKGDIKLLAWNYILKNYESKICFNKWKHLPKSINKCMKQKFLHFFLYPNKIKRLHLDYHFTIFTWNNVCVCIYIYIF